MIYFFDSSAVAKRFIEESGSDEVENSVVIPIL